MTNPTRDDALVTWAESIMHAGVDLALNAIVDKWAWVENSPLFRAAVAAANRESLPTTPEPISPVVFVVMISWGTSPSDHDEDCDSVFASREDAETYIAGIAHKNEYGGPYYSIQEHVLRGRNGFRLPPEAP